MRKTCNVFTFTGSHVWAHALCIVKTLRHQMQLEIQDDLTDNSTSFLKTHPFAVPNPASVALALYFN
jgi:hypothetical protein